MGLVGLTMRAPQLSVVSPTHRAIVARFAPTIETAACKRSWYDSRRMVIRMDQCAGRL